MYLLFSEVEYFEVKFWICIRTVSARSLVVCLQGDLDLLRPLELALDRFSPEGVR